jgi:hypothetical protein
VTTPRSADSTEWAAALAAFGAGTASSADLRLLTKHYLGVLAEAAPGRSVEIRVPPYAAAQVVAGGSHTRGTPRAVVELDAETWIALATGKLAWADAEAAGRLSASGERADLSAYLPLG